MPLDRRRFLGLAAAAAAAVLVSCADDGVVEEEGPGKVGVSLPAESQERWIQDGQDVRKQLEDAGFEVDLRFANDTVAIQQRQIGEMVAGGAEVLIIAPIVRDSLTAELDAAAAEGVRVIAYDRLLRDSPHVDFYVSFDNLQVGVDQAQALIDGLGVENRRTRRFNIELFAGPVEDNNARFYFEGAMSVLQPFIDEGRLQIRSGQVDLDEVSVGRWHQQEGQSRMGQLLRDHYADDEVLHGVLSPADIVSRGIITALQSAGYQADDMPVITGQDAEIASVKLIVDGVQHSTVFKDTRALAERAVKATVELLDGTGPTANDTDSYHNGVKVVPAFLLEPVTVTSDNVMEALVDTGYWSEEQVETGTA